MEETEETPCEILFPQKGSVFKLKVKSGSRVQKGSVLCLYRTEDNSKFIEKLRATKNGIVKDLAVANGQHLEADSLMMCIEPETCHHPIVVKMICADCGKDLKPQYMDSEVKGICSKSANLASASVSMIHNVPELMVSSDIAQDIASKDVSNLLEARKLVLIVDLDQTLIHTTNDDVPSNLKDVHHFQLQKNGAWYHTKLRPGTNEFLEEISKYFELHIITFGVRLYAHIIASILDPEEKFFHHRIMARDEIHLFGSDKTANISSLFPVGDEMVCIIDDRDDVWRYNENVIKVPAYKFFPSTGDINDPKGRPKQTPETQKSKSTAHSDIRKENNDNEKPLKKDSDETQNNQQSGQLITEKIVTESLGSCAGDISKAPRSGEDHEVQSSAKRVRFSLPADKSEVSLETHERESAATETAFTGDICSESSKADTEKLKENHDSNLMVDFTSSTTEMAQSANPTKPEESTSQSPKRKRRSFLDDDDETCMMMKNGCSEDAMVFHVTPSELKSAVKEDKNDTPEHRERSAKLAAGKGVLKSCLIDMNFEMPSNSDENEEIVWEDDDEFLPFLKNILLKVHHKFYERYENNCKSCFNGPPNIPNVKDIINETKREVIENCTLVFSAVVPTNFPIGNSREYLEAKSLGATVMETMDLSKCTHVVAARQGTHKVHQARKSSRNIKIVNPDWLWSCSQKWVKVDEKEFNLENFDHTKSLKTSWYPSPRNNFKEAKPEQTNESVALSDVHSIIGSENACNNVSVPEKTEDITSEKKITGEHMDTTGSRALKNGATGCDTEQEIETESKNDDEEMDDKQASSSPSIESDTTESDMNSENGDCYQYEIDLIESTLLSNITNEPS